MNIRKSVVAAAVAVCFCGAGLFAGVLESFSPESKLIAKVDLDKLRASSHFEKMKQNNIQKYHFFSEVLSREAGIDAEKISTIWLAGERKHCGVLVFEGSFDAEAIGKVLGAKPDCEQVQKAGCDLAYLCPDKQNPAPGAKILAALIGGKIIVAGNPSVAESFISNYTSGVPAQDFKFKNYLQGKKVVEGVIMGIEEAELKKNPFLSQFKNGFFSMDLDEKGLSMALSADMGDPEQAEAVKNILSGIVTLQKSSKEAGDAQRQIGRDEFFRTLRIESQGGAISADAMISNEVLEKLIEMNAVKKQGN